MSYYKLIIKSIVSRNKVHDFLMGIDIFNETLRKKQKDY